MLLRQTLLYLPAQLAGPLAQLLAAVLWTYFLSPEEIGLFALATATQEFAYTATLSWFTLYTVRHFKPRAHAEDHRAFLETEKVVLVLSGLANAVAILALPLIVTGDWNTSVVAAAVAYCVVRSAATHLADRARAAGDTLTYSIMQVLWPVVGLIIGLLSLLVFPPTAATLLWAFAAGQVLTLILAASRLDLRHDYEARVSVLKSAAYYAVPLVVGGIFTWFANNGIRFVIAHFEGTEAVGLVTVGWGLGLRGATFAAMLVTAAAFPLAVARSREAGLLAGQQQLIENGVLLYAVIAPAAAGLWAISTPLAQLIIAEPFREMTAAVLPWAVLAGAARNMRIHFGQQVFLLHEETKIALATDIVDGVTTMVGSIVGLLVAGLPGCLVGAAFGACAGAVSSFVWGAVKHNFVFPLSDFLKISCASVAMVLAVRAVPAPPTFAGLISVIALGAAVYAALMILAYPSRAASIWQKIRLKLGALAR